MLEVDHLPGRTLHANGRAYLYCSGTGYLGIARNPAFAELVVAGISRYGTNYGSAARSVSVCGGLSGVLHAGQYVVPFPGSA